MTRKFFQCGENHFGPVDRNPSTLHIGKHYLKCRACGRPMTPEQAGKYLTTRKSVEECMKQALQGATK